MDNWLNENAKIKYKTLFDVISNNETLNKYINGDAVDEIAFSILLDVYKDEKNCSPYDSVIINKLNFKKMGTINYLKGDATNPIGDGKKIICHVCNNVGGWGAGFVLALSKKWENPEKLYRSWASSKSTTFKLGNVQFVPVSDNIVVANMIGQHLTYPTVDENGNKIPPIRYNSLETCLNKVAEYAEENNCSVHMPKIGAGLAGGDWNRIESLINKCLVEKGIPTYVYLFE